ncbi:three-Cys-motif partner protein TcmP [Bradyrhizobium zhanjiangense]|uniref:Three-Cys-motif partner protein TcmP n=2 Tax=Bradyrhizobium zhanjiangense TaxID=1325107 RepID=A0ABY0DG03_9BRAD|nr:three-Cys-motif partner protein TcmP [Bradyrhizobium zhanjiangense]
MGMAKKEIILDPADGLIVDDVGKWATEKHARVQAYIKIASATRAKYVPPPAWRAGASYIELFSGPGRSLVRGTKRIIDGSPLVAYKAAQLSGAPFTAMHLNDFDAEKSAAVEKRIRALGGAPACYNDPAVVAVDKIVAAVNPKGLHFAFLDPYNLEGLSFDIIRKLSKLKVDLLIHVSVHDLQRNLDDYSRPGDVLDTFAPGWSKYVDPKTLSQNSFRAALMEYWLSEIRKLGKFPAEGVELVEGSKGQRLYWLVFASEHGIARRFWETIRNPMRQTAMNFDG